MSQYTADFGRVTTGGPYSYILYRNGVGIKAVIGLASVNAVINAVRDDIAPLMDPGEVVQRGSFNIESRVP